MQAQARLCSKSFCAKLESQLTLRAIFVLGGLIPAEFAQKASQSCLKVQHLFTSGVTFVPRWSNTLVKRHGRAVPRAGCRSYVTGSIHD